MKGQWFIISAVVATSIFFGISLLMKDYFIMDSSKQASLNADYHFYNIINQFNEIVSTSKTDVNCVNLTMNLDEFKTTVERSLASKGFLTMLEYTVTPPCTTGLNIVPMNLLIIDEKQLIYNFSSYNSTAQIIGAA